MIKKTLQWPKKFFIHKKNPAFVKTFKKGFFIRIYLIGCFVNMDRFGLFSTTKNNILNLKN